MNKSTIIKNIFCLYLLCIANVFASGYQLNEYSTTNLGRSFAGVGIVGDDYSAIAFNPAGMTLMKKSGIQTGITMTKVYSHVDGRGSFYGKHTKMNFWVPLPSVFAQYNINDKWFAGFGVYVPFGLATKYNSNSFVSDKAINSELEVIDTNFSLAYKATDKLSLGASVIARYIYGHMTQTANPLLPNSNIDFELDGWTATATLGAMYEFNENNRLGLTYKFKSKQTVKGDNEVSGLAGTHPVTGTSLSALNRTYKDGKASPDLPSMVMLSYYTKPFEKFAFTSTLKWTEWSVFDVFSMTSTFTELMGTKPVVYDWHDSLALSIGTDYFLNDNWTLRFGASYDQSPSRSDSTRTIRIPDNNKVWVSAGLSYVKNNIQVDLGYAHLFVQKSSIKNSVNGDHDLNFNGMYSNMVSLQLQYKF